MWDLRGSPYYLASEHQKDLMAEAATERMVAAGETRRPWRCQVCRRLGGLLIAAGVRLLRYADRPRLTTMPTPR